MSDNEANDSDYVSEKNVKFIEKKSTYSIKLTNAFYDFYILRNMPLQFHEKKLVRTIAQKTIPQVSICESKKYRSRALKSRGS